MSEEHCETCRFWEVDTSPDPDDEPKGECRRFPPSTPSLNEEYIGSFPLTYNYDWCGEWRERQALTPTETMT